MQDHRVTFDWVPTRDLEPGDVLVDIDSTKIPWLVIGVLNPLSQKFRNGMSYTLITFNLSGIKSTISADFASHARLSWAG